jgi:APA family basic amino acid/polyamine antiporter
MIGGVVSVSVVYLLVNVALLRVLPVPDLARSTLAAADAAQIVLGGHGRQIITVLSLISLPPLLNAIMMIGTRILFGLGRDRFVSSRVASVNAGDTPTVATLVTAAVALALIATGTFQRLVAVASFFLAANTVVSGLALVVLRRREPQLARPFRAWGYPWSAAVVLAGAAAFLIGTLSADTTNAAVALGLVAAGLLWRVIPNPGSRIADRESRE